MGGVLRPLGVPVPDMRAIARDISRRLKREAPDRTLELARALVAGRTFEGRSVAYELLEKRRDLVADLGVRELEALGKGNDNWASVDHFGCAVAGPAWRLGAIPDRTVHRWARSRDLWWRRTALVATVALNMKSRGGTGDPARTFPVCEILVTDRDDMVVKALSWALRAVMQHDAKGVEAFLRRHDPDLAARVKREVRNKLASGLKNPRG